MARRNRGSQAHDDSPLPAPLTSRTPRPRYQASQIASRLRNSNSARSRTISAPQNRPASVPQAHRMVLEQTPDPTMSSNFSPRGSKRRASSDGDSDDGRIKRRVLEDDVGLAEGSSRVRSGNAAEDSMTPDIGRSSRVEEESGSVPIEELIAPPEPPEEEIIVTGRTSRFIIPEPIHLSSHQQPQLLGEDQETDDETIVSSQLVHPQVNLSSTSTRSNNASSLSHILNDEDTPVKLTNSLAGTSSGSAEPSMSLPSSSKGKGKQKAEEIDSLAREVTPEAEAEATLADYTCPICFSAPTNATLTPCGHICCGSCLFAAIKAALKRGTLTGSGRDEDGARCPVCRAPIPGWDGKGGGVIGLKIRAKFSL
ncbi:hypothetical protein VNI00_000163 [Paramarasmius palmivorus]|uniref:RING-type domain-containing protein n=1 Tax=Paramarasmius palmivorus TaxID=297713 RepID=A0AAW0ECN1_9AGAR